MYVADVTGNKIARTRVVNKFTVHTIGDLFSNQAERVSQVCRYSTRVRNSRASARQFSNKMHEEGT